MKGLMMKGETAVLLLDGAFSFAMVVAVVVGSIALAALALVVGGLALHSLRALMWVLFAMVLGVVFVGIQAVCARLTKK